MDVTLTHPGALAPDDLDAWRKLRAADARYASPFFAPEFALAAGVGRGDARVLVARGSDGAIDLILPVQLGGAGLARPLGAPLCDVNGPIVSLRGLEAALPAILAAGGIAAYAFSGWPEAKPAPGVKPRQREGSAVADLAQGFEAWLSAQRELHPKHFKKMRRLTRQAEHDFGAMSVGFGPARAEDLATLIRWKREQFARTRRHDVLRPEWTRALLEACALERGEGLAGVMATLHLEGRLAAAEFGLRSGQVLHGWIAGYEPAFASCSPGLILQEKLLEAAAAAGVREAVLGTGETHYKKYYCSYQTAVDEGTVAASGIAGGARALAAGLLDAVEQGGFGPASRLAGRTRRRLDVILAVEVSVGDQVRGLARALGEDPAVSRTGAAIKAAARASAF